jgi:hypothetical protein
MESEGMSSKETNIKERIECEKCGNQIKFCTGWANGNPTFETFDCVKEKGHMDDHHTYGHTGESNHYWSLNWWEKEKL